jgi:hypothetical protein
MNKRAFAYLAPTFARLQWSQAGVPVPLEFEEFAEAFGLLAGDGNFGGFFVVHF